MWAVFILVCSALTNSCTIYGHTDDRRYADISLCYYELQQVQDKIRDQQTALVKAMGICSVKDAENLTPEDFKKSGT